MDYFVISTGEGGIYIEALSNDVLVERLEERWWGDKVALTALPARMDPNYWGDALVIIKGKVITPKVVETATRITVE